MHDTFFFFVFLASFKANLWILATACHCACPLNWSLFFFFFFSSQAKTNEYCSFNFLMAWVYFSTKTRKKGGSLLRMCILWNLPTNSVSDKHKLSHHMFVFLFFFLGSPRSCCWWQCYHTYYRSRCETHDAWWPRWCWHLASFPKFGGRGSKWQFSR